MINLFSILDKNFKIKYFTLLFLIFLTIFVDLFSFTSIIPFLNFIFIPFEDLKSSNSYFNDLVLFFDLNNQRELIFFCIIFIILIFLFKFIFYLFFYYFESKFLYFLQYQLSQQTYKKILSYDYQKFKLLHSSEIIRNITSEVNACIGVLNSINILIVEISVSSLLIIFVIFLNQAILIPSIIFMIIIAVLYFFIFKKRLKLWGTERQEIESYRIKQIYEGVKGFKELKSYNLENFFLKSFSNSNWNYSEINKKQYLINQYPRLFLEFILIVFIFLLLIILINNNNFNNAIISLGIIAAFSFRLLPSINKILINYQNIKFYKPSIDVIQKILNTDIKIPKTNFSNITFGIESIFIKDLNFNYEKKNIFKNVNLKIFSDEHIGLVGESGVGKTTFVNILLGLEKPSSGQIIINNDEKLYASLAHKNLISYVPQEQFLINDTITNNIVFGFHSIKNKNDINIPLIKSIIKRVNLNNLIDSLPKGLNTILEEDGSNLSTGQIQRIILARALYRQPKLIILDEATSALDTYNEKMIMDIIHKLKKSGIIVIAISHNPNFFQKFDKIYTLKNYNLFLD